MKKQPLLKTKLEKEKKQLKLQLYKVESKLATIEANEKDKKQSNCKTHNFGGWRHGHNSSFAECLKCGYITESK